MDEHLLALLNYDGVLGVVVTTPDGLVIAASGLEHDDAEIVGAAGSTVIDGGRGDGSLVWDSIEVRAGVLHVLADRDLTLIALTEADVPPDAMHGPMRATLEEVASAMS